MRSAFLVLLCLLVCGFAHADVVHLTTGRSISGKVIREDSTSVVVQTPDGKLTLPRKLVERIERQTSDQTLIELARDHDRAGSFDKARALYERAAASDDPRVAELATAELARFDRRRERAQGFRDKPRTPLPLPAGTTGERLEGDSLQEQLDRARKALEDGTPRRAKRLLEPLQTSNPDDPYLAYLYGRALQETGDEEGARPLFLKAAGPLFRRDPRGAPWLRELARRRLSGEELDRETPGVGRDWERVASKHVVIYHRLRRAPSWLASDAEAALQRALQRLDVRYRELRLGGRVQVFLLAEVDHRYALRSGYAAHGDYTVAPDGYLVRVYAVAERDRFRQALEHELGHLVAFERAERLPAWCREGAAAYAESDARRLAYRERVRRRHTELPELRALLAGEVDRAAAAEDFDAQSSVLFEALTTLKETPRRVFKLGVLLEQEEDGLVETLRLFKLDLEQVESTYRRLAGVE